MEFNERTRFSDDLKPIKDELLELGKNPGLGIRSIQESGINGSGISVAIIDQPLLLDHYEYENKIIKYRNFDKNKNADSSSMHGPAVLSILAGKHIGVAPKVNVMYAAVPSWNSDIHDVTDAIDWIIEENNKLPEANKVRIISISACPIEWSTISPDHWVKDEKERRSNIELWNKTIEKTKENNILILSCNQDVYSFDSCYYDVDDPDNMEKISIGYPNKNSVRKESLLLPTSLRTVAEYYSDGVKSYTYTGVGGLSWGIPYLAGLIALSLEINPTLSGEEVMKYVYDTAYVKDGHKIINPTLLIKAIRETKEKNYNI